MVDEKLVIEKLESLKDKADNKLRKPYMTKYVSPDAFCKILDDVIEYINNIKVDGVCLDKDEYEAILEYMGQGN